MDFERELLLPFRMVRPTDCGRGFRDSFATDLAVAVRRRFTVAVHEIPRTQDLHRQELVGVARRW